ncbi:MAG TPA: hypothetical protein VHC69_20695 [Polyangiaceae bacterium]|nr:hypothetical protein [Polyangiaceae bacterium]
MEISRLVSTGDGVFQPRSTRIEGKGAIVEALRRSKYGKGLVDGAAKLVGGGTSQDDASFDAVDGGWVPSSRSPSYAKQVAHDVPPTPAEAALLAELTVLRASHEGLVARVARLERLLARRLDGAPVQEKPSRRGAHAASAPPPQEASAASALPREAPAAEVPSPSADEPAESPPAHTSDDRALGAIEFPALGLITDALKQLCGNEIPLKEMKNAGSAWLSTPERFYASWLVDEAGEVQGGVVCDCEAVARLGGAYLAMPQADIEAQAASDQVGEELVSATSDICTTFAGLVNDSRDNPRVRATPLGRFAEGAPPWIESPSVRTVCVHPGGGTVAFLSR